MARNFSSGSNVQISPQDAFKCKDGGATIAFWLRTTQSNSNTGIASNWNGSSRGGLGILLNNVAGQVAFVANGGLSPGGNISTSGAAVNDGNWHHIAITFDRTGASNNCRLYKDGVFSNQGTLDANWVQGGQTMIIGAAADGFWARYNGDLAEWGHWDGKLTDLQIAALASGAPCGYVNPAKLELYLPFFESILDFGRNRFSVSNSSSVSTKAHPRVRNRLFSAMGASLTDAKPPLRELAGVKLSYRINGTKDGRRSHGKMNFGMFGSGRVTTSNYVYPSGFSPKVIVVM